MAFEMVDRDQRLARRQREPLAGEQPDHHPADQARPGGRGDGVDLAERDVGLGQHLPDQPGQDLDMGARGDLGHDAAERPVRLVLPDHRLGEDLPVAGDQRRRAVVAGGFEAEDQRHLRRAFASMAARFALARRPMIDARFTPRHARLAAGAGPGAHGRARRSRRRMAGPRARSRSSPITTSGDRIQDRPLAEVGGKALWTKELDRALLDGETDCSVHSMKDVESERPDALRDRGDAASAPTSATG